MTRSEAIGNLIHAIRWNDMPKKEALDMAVKALKQEPCEECVSRQAALDAFGLSEKTRKYGGDHSGYDMVMLYEIQDILEDLPSVTPAQKTGRWKRVSIDKYVQHAMAFYRCSECRGESIGMSKYCQNCGTKMEEENNG